MVGGEEEKPQVPVRLRSGQALHYATPDFLLSLVASASFMRLSLLKAAHVAVGEIRVQEIRVRSGRDDSSFAETALEAVRGMAVDGPTELSSRPERSVAEGPAVFSSYPKRH